jgi:hypothetical protein
MDRRLAASLDHWLTTPPDTEPPGPPCEHSRTRCLPGCRCGCYECYHRSLDHDCPRTEFLDDPITVAYGVGGEMVKLIPCAVCDTEAEQ